MPLTPGSRLGVYDITAPLGEGGMGQVYRATDTNLKRSVAIKVLPVALAGDADRLALPTRGRGARGAQPPEHRTTLNIDDALVGRATQSLAPGTRLGVYEITAQIGEGGMRQLARSGSEDRH